MPLNDAGIFYADGNTEMSIGVILATLASSVNNSLGTVQTVTASGTGSVYTDFTVDPVYTSSGLTASITPTSADSQIAVLVNLSHAINTNAEDGVFAEFQVRRNGTPIGHYVEQVNNIARTYLIAGGSGVLSVSLLDKPATTSKLDYTVWGKTQNGKYGSVTMSGASSSMVLLEIPA